MKEVFSQTMSKRPTSAQMKTFLGQVPDERVWSLSSSPHYGVIIVVEEA